MTPEVRETLRSVGGYDLIAEIGRGGAAVVYLAHQRDLGRDVALKQLAPFQTGDPTFAARFIQESRVAGSLSHPNIVAVHEYFERDGTPYIAMEHMPHGSLRGYIGQLSLAQIAGVLEGVLAGLARAERDGIVHRDLKPENLLVTADGAVKIADFGIAKAINAAATLAAMTATGSTVGTPAYMAPEQALGREIGPRADLYSLGVISWELLAGIAPFAETETPVAVLYRHVHESIPSVRTIAPDVDEEIAAWLERMLAKEPDDRFDGARAAWEALEDIVLRLLGPVWRREARLGEGESAEAARALTPAPFSEPLDASGESTPPDASARPPGDHVENVAVGNDVDGRAPRKHLDSVAADAPAGITPTTDVEYRDDARHGEADQLAAAAHVTAQPRRLAVVARTTMHRIMLRPEGPAPASAEPGVHVRRWILLALVIGIISAAGLGVVVGNAGSNGGNPTASTSPGARAAASRAAVERQARPALAAVLQAVAAGREQGLTKLASARTPQEQSDAANVVARAFASGTAQIEALGPPRNATPHAVQLLGTLRAIANDYARLAAAAHVDNARAYTQSAARLRTEESRLRSQAAALASGT